MTKGYLVLESGECFGGDWISSAPLSPRIGEVVFNTSHAGYQEIASDPSYFSQIMVMTAPMQGNYGFREGESESEKIWIEGFVCTEIQNNKAGSQWMNQLLTNKVPILSGADTRKLTIRLREGGTPWGAIVAAESEEDAKVQAQKLFQSRQLIGLDWTEIVGTKKSQVLKGHNVQGPRVAVMDFGTKKNILQELQKDCSEILLVPAQGADPLIREWDADGILLSNGPGDPSFCVNGIESVQKLIGWKPMFGICMGHQVLALALGAKTYKMKFGHHGGNQPVKDALLNQVYVTSQNHGYAVDPTTLPSQSRVTHVNLYDKTVEGFECAPKKCWSVQFHPESNPGPHEAKTLFKLFMDKLI
ncbi:MAG: glutamine-hydrolyzing carbamoyl-phosphate synthase small subunit [Bdellovibrionales bacterium]